VRGVTSQLLPQEVRRSDAASSNSGSGEAARETRPSKQDDGAVREIDGTGKAEDGMTNSQLQHAEESGRRTLAIEENFLGSQWAFVKAIGGNYWYHRPTGKTLMASSTW
jgi:hypothetical protein